MKRKALLVGGSFAVLAVAFAAQTASRTYTLKDPKGVNSLTINIDSALEPIQGLANGISGELNFNPDKPEATTGKLILDVKSLKLGNEAMTGYMLQKDYLDATAHPTASFTISKVSDVKIRKSPKPDVNLGIPHAVYTAKVTGSFSLKGVSKTITVPATLSYFKDGLASRGAKLVGDLAVIRCNFSFKRFDYGVDGGLPENLIGNKVDVTMSLAASSPNK